MVVDTENDDHPGSGFSYYNFDEDEQPEGLVALIKEGEEDDEWNSDGDYEEYGIRKIYFWAYTPKGLDFGDEFIHDDEWVEGADDSFVRTNYWMKTTTSPTTKRSLPESYDWDWVLTTEKVINIDDMAQLVYNGECLKVIDCIEGLKELDDNSVDTIVTSPPYNKKGLLGKVKQGNQIWGKFNIDYATYDDNMPEDEYQAWQIELLNQCHRVIKEDGSIFYNHKPRRYQNRAYLPWDFIQHSDASLYQLIVWDRRNSPNIRNDVLTPCTEHIYWLCKKKPKVFRDQVDPAL